jgi:transcriptional regulator with XRE-family HTH domain
MAKIKVRPRPGALSDLLKRKGMTQTDAANGSVDRKTLSRIERGEEVKQETLQRLAKKLGVPGAYFETSSASQMATPGDDEDRDEFVILRKLDVDGLVKCIFGAATIRWLLNIQAVSEKNRALLEEFEKAVQALYEDIMITEVHEDDWYTLRYQLGRLKKKQDVATLLEQIAEHRLAVLGADYQFWEKYDLYDGDGCPYVHYKSQYGVLLSIEPIGTQSRREWFGFGERGQKPPKFAPDPYTNVVVNGMRLDTEEDVQRKTEDTDDNNIPF